MLVVRNEERESERRRKMPGIPEDRGGCGGGVSAKMIVKQRTVRSFHMEM